METFKYYKRGEGELDTSNFSALCLQSHITVESLDSKTFVSLLSLQMYMQQVCGFHSKIKVVVEGYVEHMRGDKDLFPTSSVYATLNRYEFICLAVQHESTAYVKSALLSKKELSKDVPSFGKVMYIGADSSVPKFFPSVDAYATKVRTDGKVTSLDFDTNLIPKGTQSIVIVDDLLGGGATVDMLRELIWSSKFKGYINLWTRYNEGIHAHEFLTKFDNSYIGDEV